MRKLFTLFMISLVAHVVWGQSGVGYDPENPADPNVYYNLSLEASPSTGGTIDPSSTRSLEAGSGVYCYASAKKGYVFKQWMEGDSVVSTNRNFYYTMPNHDVVLTAYFDYVGYNYDPENPGDPFEDGYKHKVALCSNPKNAGYFNNNDFYLVEGDSINVYAYPNNGFKFESWEKDGITISRSNPLNIKMDSLDLTYTANFIYDPVNPGNPAVNNFNPHTGELIIDEFTEGQLNSAISLAIGDWDNYSLIQSMVIMGKMIESDFGFNSSMQNCSFFDLGRTTGFTNVPSFSFYENSVLSQIILPSCVEEIEDYAFYNCSNLTEMTCYALFPPKIGYQAFKGVSKDLIVRVPSSVRSYYCESEIWKDFKILPLNNEISVLTISLPKDAIDGRYKNMTLELNNISSGQVLKYLITDRVNYKFANIINNTKFNIFVKNPAGIVLGSIMDVEVNDRNVHVEFESLLQTQIVELNILTPDGNDVTSETVITWKDNVDNYLGQGSVLKNVIEGSTVNYSVALSRELGLQYMDIERSNYVVKGSNNTITCQLQPFAEVQVTGSVKDVTTNDAISGAMVTISQQLNGKYSKSQTVYTDADGTYSATVYVAPTNMTFAANNYLSQSYEITDVTKAESMQTVYLKAITGAIVSVNFTYTPCVGEGVTAEMQDWYDDYANVAYSIYNNTTQKAITDFKVQGTSIVLLEEVKEGDVLSITASSKNGSFSDILVEGIVDSKNRIKITIPIVEMGGVQATYEKADNKKNVGVLYDANGVLVKKINYSNKTLSIYNLLDGKYTLVSMRDSKFFNSVLNILELKRSGLQEGVDFVRNDFEIKKGRIETINIENIPEFDESSFYYTGANTMFMVNKSDVTVGNYITFKAKVDFKNEYQNLISDVRLIFDLPDGCKFVEGSVLSGIQTEEYLVDGNRIIVYIKNIINDIRFCVIPIVGAEYKPSALVQFTLNGQEFQQPIGSTYFKAKNMEISVPTKTMSSSVVVKGVAKNNSQIKIYDNNRLVGQSNATANGQWTANIELHNTCSWSKHMIYAEIMNVDKTCYVTDTKELIFSENLIEPLNIKMIYLENEIDFNISNRENSKKSYTYRGQLGSKYWDYTFIAEFPITSSMIWDVKFAVLLTDGSVEYLKGFQSKTGFWVANGKFPNDKKVPINVAVTYQFLSNDNIDNTGLISEEVNNILSQNKCITDFWGKNDEVLSYNDSDNSFSFKTAVMEDYEWIVSERNYEETLALTDSIQFSYGNDGNNWFCYHVTSNDELLKVILIDFSEKLAVDIVVKDIYNKKVLINPQKVNLNVMNGITGIGANLTDLIGIPNYNNVYGDVSNLIAYMNWSSGELAKYPMKIDKLLRAKCQNGDPRITPTIESFFRLDLASLIKQQNNYLERFEKNIFEYKKKLGTHAALNVASAGVGLFLTKIKAVGNFVGKFATELIELMDHGKTWWAYNSQSVAESVVNNTIAIAHNGMESTAGLFRPDFTDYTRQYDVTWTWAHETTSELMNEYRLLEEKIKNAYRSCPEDNDDNEQDEEDDNEEDEDKDNSDETQDKDIFKNPNLEPVIDPSGYVYEAVSSNRLAGVTATAYYKEFEEDMYGDIHENVIKWDAAEYAQENPLFTDEDGRYAWDVPQGLWQVKFEKEGYETTYSEWLPVPPPQLEVNIAMTQLSHPEIKLVHAYSGGVEIEFDKYMLPETLINDNIYVCENGEKVEGQIVFINEELSYKDETDKYVSKIRFIPASVFSASEIILTISNKVKSYSGIQMQETFTQTFDVEPEISSIEVDSVINVNFGETKVMRIKVLPPQASAGKIVSVKSSSSFIASLFESDVILDENGEAEIYIIGEMLGTAMLDYKLEDYDILASSVVKVKLKETNKTANPIASIASGSEVEKGTLVTLECSTPNAEIYYTLDGTCPCDDATRILYDGTPIIINETTTLKIIAYAEGCYESEVVTYNYTVKESIGLDVVTLSGSIRLYPVPVKSVLTISASGLLLQRVLLFDMSGKCVCRHDETSEQVTLDVSGIPAGIYVAKIETAEESCMRKVIKIE